MNLRSIKLRDWKAYPLAHFEFPAPSAGKNVILIGAPNGFGKTSLFEALTLGLFGREGLPLVPRATLPQEGEAEAKLNTSYSKFLTDALHKRALKQGRNSCSVELEFEDDEGDPITLERKWHFAANGQHKPYDDELFIYEGRTRKPLGPPPTITDRSGWYREYIAQNFLPSYLAAFFLFDGEQVQRFAKREMAGQVRRGVEGLLGLPVLKSLRESLLKYSTNRRSQVATPSNSKVSQVKNEIESYEAIVRDLQKKIDEVNGVLPNLEAERDDLSNFFASFGGGSVALVGELHREEDTLRASADRALESLMSLLSGDVAMALSGEKLRSAAIAQLRAEAIREAWEAGRTQGMGGLRRFLDKLAGQLEQVSPSLSQGQKSRILAEAEAAWASLWHPAPDGCAETIIHLSLSNTDRERAVERLTNSARASSGDLRELLRVMREGSEKAEEKKRQRLALELSAPEADEKRTKLQSLSEQIGQLREARDKAGRELLAAEAELARKRQELGRYTDAIGRGAVPLRQAERAESVARMIEKLLDSAVPSQVGEVASAMTAAWKEMARKKDLVQKIEISSECDVTLLNSRGENIREMQLSAGEEQIFTQALISAVSQVSGREFPFVVDTPLGRLDDEHRVGVLRHFTNRGGQLSCSLLTPRLLAPI